MSASVWNPSGFLRIISSAFISFLQRGTGAVTRTAEEKLQDVYNVKDFGAVSTNTTAQNRTALQTAIAAVNDLGGGIIVVDYDIDYGVKTRTPSTWPSFTGTTYPICVIDHSRGDTQLPNVYPTSYDGMQTRYWYSTPQTTSPGQHDGNTLYIRGTWNPNIFVTNDADYTGVRTASDNRRNYLSFGVLGSATWGVGNGTLAGATLTDEEMSNFVIQKFAAPGDTLGNYAPLTVERKTGNMSYGGGSNIPSAHHHFQVVTGSPLIVPEMLVESPNTLCRFTLRTSAGVGQDFTISNNAGSFNFTTAAGDALQISNANRRVFVPGALQNKFNNVAYSANIVLDTTLGNIFSVTATNGSAFTFAAPTNPVAGQIIDLTIKNTSGGALGAVTFNAVFKLAAWVSPATGFNRTITFYYDGTNWIEKSRTNSDIPN